MMQRPLMLALAALVTMTAAAAADGAPSSTTRKSSAARVSPATPVAGQSMSATPGLSIRITAEMLDLSELLQRGDKKVPRRDSQSERIFADTPIRTGALRAVDGMLDIHIGRLLLAREHVLQDVTAHATIRHGVLTIDPIAVTGATGGRMSGSFRIDASSANATRVAAKIDAKGIELGNVFALLGVAQGYSGGRTDATLSLAARGASVREWVSTLNGDVRLVMGPARGRPAALDALGSDVILEVLNTVNPFRRKDPETQIQCFVARFPIRDGVAIIDKGLALETSKVNAIASGAVNLSAETLDLAIHPEPREGLGISVGSLASMVRVRGPLRDPKMVIDPAGTARTAVTIGTAVLTAGASLVAEGLFDRYVAQNPCKAALGVTPAAASSTEKASGKSTLPFGLEKIIGR